MTKRQRHLEAREQEKKAVRMRLAGKTLREIKRVTTVDGFIVKGLVFAHAISLGR